MTKRLPVLLALLATPVLAEESRQLDSHEHGVGALNIALDGKTVAMEFHAPGADLVGFEYEAETAEDRAAIDDAVATLARPLDLFVLPASAECSVTEARASLESDDDHGEQDHGEEHAEHGHDAEHGHEEHAHEDEHGHDEHEEHAHDAHADEDSHTEFHAEYTLTCGNPDGLNEITFAYFDRFENAHEVEVQIVSASGAQAFEVGRDDPVLDLRGMF